MTMSDLLWLLIMPMLYWGRAEIFYSSYNTLFSYSSQATYLHQLTLETNVFSLFLEEFDSLSYGEGWEDVVNQRTITALPHYGFDGWWHYS